MGFIVALLHTCNLCRCVSCSSSPGTPHLCCSPFSPNIAPPALIMTPFHYFLPCSPSPFLPTSSFDLPSLLSYLKHIHAHTAYIIINLNLDFCAYEGKFGIGLLFQFLKLHFYFPLGVIIPFFSKSFTHFLRTLCNVF